MLSILPPHKNIIKLIDYEITKDRRLNLILEYCENGSLADYMIKYISKEEKIPKKEGLRICKEMLEGIQHLHKYNIIH